MKEKFSYVGLLGACALVLIKSYRDVSLGTGAASLEVALLGVFATILSGIFATIMFRSNHKLGRSFALECLADFLAAGSTAAFAIATYYGTDIPDFERSALRVAIIGSGQAANFHIFWVLFSDTKK